MKIHVYSPMYNEEVLLPYWLRHYETFADQIFVWDDDSTDSTREILSKHPKVTLLPREKHGLWDDYFVDELFPQYKQYSRGIADWVIAVDADEFVYHPNLKEVLKTQKEKYNIQIIQCQGFSMLSDKLPTTNGQIYDEINMGVPDYLETKWVIHSPEIDVYYRKGRHGYPHGFKIFRNKSRYPYNGIKLLHYRYLGKEYIEKRGIKNRLSNNLAHEIKIKEYDINEPMTRPDRSQGSISEWLKYNKQKAIKII